MVGFVLSRNPEVLPNPCVISVLRELNDHMRAVVGNVSVRAHDTGQLPVLHSFNVEQSREQDIPYRHLGHPINIQSC